MTQDDVGVNQTVPPCTVNQQVLRNSSVFPLSHIRLMCLASNTWKQLLFQIEHLSPSCRNVNNGCSLQTGSGLSLSVYTQSGVTVRRSRHLLMFIWLHWAWKSKNDTPVWCYCWNRAFHTVVVNLYTLCLSVCMIKMTVPVPQPDVGSS